jgi:hypothetical protein
MESIIEQIKATENELKDLQEKLKALNECRDTMEKYCGKRKAVSPPPSSLPAKKPRIEVVDCVSSKRKAVSPPSSSLPAKKPRIEVDLSKSDDEDDDDEDDEDDEDDDEDEDEDDDLLFDENGVLRPFTFQEEDVCRKMTFRSGCVRFMLGMSPKDKLNVENVRSALETRGHRFESTKNQHPALNLMKRICELRGEDSSKICDDTVTTVIRNAIKEMCK